MKKKDYILFIGLFFSILGIYLSCITHIDIFITNYEGKTFNYENNFFAESQYNNIIYNILNRKVEVATLDHLDKIIASDYLLNVLSYFFGYSKEDTIACLKKYVRQQMVNAIYTEFYDTPVIYITSNTYSLLFTLDGKNIYYNKLLSGETCTKNVSPNRNSSIDTISTNVNNIMNNIGIKKNIGFDITSIRKAASSDYYELYGTVYYVEDKSHDIKITYELDCDVVYILKLGFKELDYF